MNFWRSAITHLAREFALPKFKPAFEAGLRAALGLTVPIIIGWQSNRAGLGTLAAIGSWFVLLADVGGTYRQKLWAMSAATIALPLTVLAAGLAGQSLWAGSALTFVWVALAGLGSTLAVSFAQISFLSSVVLVIALGFTTPQNMVQEASLCLSGGIWATTLSLLIWSVHPNQPTRDVIAVLYQRLASLLRSASGGPDLATSTILHAFQQDLTNGRAIWTVIRARRSGPTEAERQLLISLENAQQALRPALAFRELLQTVAAEQPDLRPALDELAHQFAEEAENLGRAILRSRPPQAIDDLIGAYARLREAYQLKRAGQIESGSDYRAALNLGHFVRHASLLLRQFQRINEILGGRTPIDPLTHESFIVVPVTKRTPWWEVLRANLTFRSVPFRHAVRSGALTVFAQWIGNALPWSRGYWVAVTVLVILKADYGSTISRTIQRLVGTALGCLIAAPFAILIRNAYAEIAVVAFTAFVSFCLRPLNYGVFVIALTPVFMVMINIADPQSGRLLLLRTFDTVLGGILSLAGAYLILPDWERVRFPAQVANGLRTNAAYFRQAMNLYLQTTRDPAALEQAHQQAELADANLTASSQRLLAEPSHQRGKEERWVTVVVYLRALTDSISTLAELGREPSVVDPLPGLSEIREAIFRELMGMADRFESGQSIPPDAGLEEHLTPFRHALENLQMRRLEERRQDATTVTPIVHAVRQNTFLSVEFDSIINKINVLRANAAPVAA